MNFGIYIFVGLVSKNTELYWHANFFRVPGIHLFERTDKRHSFITVSPAGALKKSFFPYRQLNPLNQNHFIIRSINFCFLGVYGGANPSKPLIGAHCFKTARSFEKALNPKKPFDLPNPLLLTPPKGRLSLKK
jgi:hypothetical protein